MEKYVKKMYSMVLVVLMIASVLFVTMPTTSVSAADVPPTVSHVYITTNGGNVTSNYTVQYTYNGNGVDEGATTFQWLITSYHEGNTTAAFTAGAGTTSNGGKTYTPTAAEATKYLHCVVTPKNSNGVSGSSIMSFTFGPLVAVNTTLWPSVVAESLKMWAATGKVGDTIYAHYAYQCTGGYAEGASVISWYRIPKQDYTGGGPVLITSGVNLNTYTIKPEDYGYYITFTAGVKSVQSAASSNLAPTGTNGFVFSPENVIFGASTVGGPTGRTTANIYALSNSTLTSYGDFSNGNFVYGANNLNNEITADAGKIVDFDRILCFINGINTSIRPVTISYSTDGVKYKSVGYNGGILYPPNTTTDGIITGRNNDVKLDQVVSGRYIRLTFDSTTSASDVRLFQAYLQPASFSELFGTTLSGAVVNRDGKTITNIASGTTVDDMINSFSKLNASSAPNPANSNLTGDYTPILKVRNDMGVEITGSTPILSGYTLEVVSQNSRTKTSYGLSLVNSTSLPTITSATSNVAFNNNQKVIQVPENMSGQALIDALAVSEGTVSLGDIAGNSDVGTPSSITLSSSNFNNYMIRIISGTQVASYKLVSASNTALSITPTQNIVIGTPLTTILSSFVCENPNSTKSVVDINGGVVKPSSNLVYGDKLRVTSADGSATQDYSISTAVDMNDNFNSYSSTPIYKATTSYNNYTITWPTAVAAGNAAAYITAEQTDGTDGNALKLYSNTTGTDALTLVKTLRPNDPNIEGVVVLEAKVKTSDKNTNKTIFYFNNVSGLTDRSRINFATNGNITYGAGFGIGTYNVDTWYHIVEVIDFKNAWLKIYIDGALVKSETITTGVNLVSVNVASVTSGKEGTLYVDDFKMYNVTNKDIFKNNDFALQFTTVDGSDNAVNDINSFTGNLTIKAKLSNHSMVLKTISAKSLIALYNNNKLIGFDIKDCPSISANNGAQISLNVSVPTKNTGDNFSVKVFAWDTFENLQPLVNTQTKN